MAKIQCRYEPIAEYDGSMDTLDMIDGDDGRLILILIVGLIRQRRA